MDRTIGKPLPRLEDARLLSGGGCYSDDFSLPDQVHGAVVRSPHALARIAAVDARAARTMPGVLLILTAEDLHADGLQPVPHAPMAISPPDIRLDNSDGSPVRIVRPAILADGMVRYVGEPVAFVVAESHAAAMDAAEAVEVDYQPLEAVADAQEASKVPERVVVDARVGDAAGAAAGFAKAAHVVRLSTSIPRVAGVPMEPRAALGAYDDASGRYTLRTGPGGVGRARRELAIVLGVPPEQVRVVARDIGGNFGTRNYFFPEFGLVCWAARKVGRPVKWSGDRREAFLSDYAARDFHIGAALALDADGTFLGLEATSLSNLGAYTASFIPLTKGVQLMSSLYVLPAAARALGVLTDTPSTAPYRSAGRPEVMYVMERLIDLAAQAHGFDRVALRRRNLIRATPHTNAFGITYDSGDYAGTLDTVLALADWDGYPARREESSRRGLRRGLGLSGYMESQSGAPQERAEVTVLADGTVEVVIGTLSTGQGHATSLAQLAGEWLQVPPERVRLVTGDSDRVTVGAGSHSGRSVRVAATTIHQAAAGILAKAVDLAVQSLEADRADIAYADGRFTVKGTDRGIGLFELAGIHGPIGDAADLDSRLGSFPYGWHVCEVEVDVETGAVAILRYTAVDDVGRAVNPMIIDGQTHGGIAQGAGEALIERTAYDTSGQLLSASFMDYALPRADALPSFVTALSEVPSTNHPLGFRGGGEGGITPALGVIANAVVDALAGLGVTHIEMPMTSERVWQAIQDARGAA
ncbi:xanthine dehydrogenase family protein molybdopterin-binding subunit [Reyranella sp.]|uniref:xanthine dehydrogenase family protein molybdopterin-binding subunit n=1 Tax=Reyranella sp. TaxID=1929291 RepID=UPI003BAAA0F0